MKRLWIENKPAGHHYTIDIIRTEKHEYWICNELTWVANCNSWCKTLFRLIFFWLLLAIMNADMCSWIVWLILTKKKKNKTKEDFNYFEIELENVCLQVAFIFCKNRFLLDLQWTDFLFPFQIELNVWQWSSQCELYNRMKNNVSNP